MNLKSSLGVLLTLLGIAAGSLASGSAHAELFVIAHSATQISASDIRDIFTGEKQFAGSTKLAPVDNGSVQDSFLSSALKIDTARYNTIWTKKSFREGLSSPPVKSGDNDVLDFVRKTPGAVGYVKAPPSGVNIVKQY